MTSWRFESLLRVQSNASMAKSVVVNFSVVAAAQLVIVGLSERFFGFISSAQGLNTTTLSGTLNFRSVVKP